MLPYASIDEALADVLRLSRGMTYKNAVAGLPLGGGKSVVIADPASVGKDQLLRAMGKHVQRLNGRYWTAIDMGVSATDTDTIAEECDFVFARASEFKSDDPPAHYTALGGFQGVRAMAQFLRGKDDLRGLRVAVQGVGQTGAGLISLLVGQGAEVIATDINENALSRIAGKYGVKMVTPEAIYDQQVDVFAPCAMGGILNDHTIPLLKCTGIAGLANNQLDRPDHGQQLLDRNIAYAPDFVVNSGGVIRATMPIFSEPNPSQATRGIAGLFTTIVSILEQSRKENIPTEAIAEAIGEHRLKTATELNEQEN